MKRSTSAISPAKDEPKSKRSKTEKPEEQMEIDVESNVVPAATAPAVLSIGHPAPHFTAEAVSAAGEFVNISLSDYKGKYLVLFFYPLDFTFVCPTEIIAFSDSIQKFKQLNCEVLGVSVDSKYSHLAWINTPRKQGGVGALNIPLLADLNKEVSTTYQALYKNTGHTLRALFIIGNDEKQTLRHITMNEPPVGRSVDEVLRLVQAFQYNDIHGEVCPANWTPGAKTIQPDPTGKLTYFNEQFS